jgi:hypothetical protein
MLAANSNPFGISVSGGFVYFTEFLANQIGRLKAKLFFQVSIEIIFAHKEVRQLKHFLFECFDYCNIS